jgi:hypothetical protein
VPQIGAFAAVGVERRGPVGRPRQAQMATTAADGPDRLALLARVREVIAEQVPVVPLFDQSKITLLAKRVHDVLPQSSTLGFGKVFVSST